MSNKEIEKKLKKQRRAKRTRAKIHGTEKLPRLAVSRSIKHISCQLIDDDTGKTIVSVSDKGLKGNKTEVAKQVGTKMAELAVKNKIGSIVFDRRDKKYHGRVKALAEAVREGGVKF
ncbi:50S ribosomal protein L18 [Patescibacteria group bacterium]|nr:50S ribosomal protein L18 [Patescibacteria group bacterium]MBU1673660.1 50S ribosomal protein L18 [Patescibacteria group bacterium]MBU1963852.1 50S ribosomal protein L18 [Patescibacteria group bacterium]